jgi:tetratricopeptide (TPR) repeat protein/CheY-like chemotaxis protein
MDHVSIGHLIAVTESIQMTEQIQRVAHICRSKSVHVFSDYVDAREHLKAIANQKKQPFPDLIVLDLKRPFANALEFLTRLRKSSELSLAGAGVLCLVASQSESKEIVGCLAEMSGPFAQIAQISRFLVSPCTDLRLEEMMEELSAWSAPDPSNLDAVKGTLDTVLRASPDKALNTLNFAIAKYPDHPEYKCMKIIFTQRFGEHEKCVSLSKEYLNSHPDFTPFHHALASSSVALGDLETAIKVLKNSSSSESGQKFAIKFDTFSNISRGLNNEGIKLTKSGDLKGAERIYRLALEASEHLPNQHRYLLCYNMGKNQQRQRNFEEAINCYIESSQLAPQEFVEPMVAYAQVLEILKKETQDQLAFSSAQNDMPPDKNLLQKNSKKKSSAQKAVPTFESEQLANSDAVADALFLQQGGNDNAINESDTVVESYSLEGLEDLEIDDPFSDGEMVGSSSDEIAGSSPTHTALDALRGFEFSSEFDEVADGSEKKEDDTNETIVSTSAGLDSLNSTFDEFTDPSEITEDLPVASEEQLKKDAVKKARLAFVMFDLALPEYRKALDNIRIGKMTQEKT